MNVFGPIPGIDPGFWFENRRAVARSGVHRPPQAGISGSQTEGADSIVISGGYVDDEDHGDEITYTGHGGIDLDTGRQIADQEMKRGNKALVISHEKKLPVRVIRGSRGDPRYSPESGYRYDGIFYVSEYWSEKGVDGFLIWRYKLTKAKQELVDKSLEPKDRSSKRRKKNLAIPPAIFGLIEKNHPELTPIKDIFSHVQQSIHLSSSDLEHTSPERGPVEPFWVHDIKNWLKQKKDLGQLINPKRENWGMPKPNTEISYLIDSAWEEIVNSAKFGHQQFSHPRGGDIFEISSVEDEQIFLEDGKKESFRINARIYFQHFVNCGGVVEWGSFHMFGWVETTYVSTHQICTGTPLQSNHKSSN